MKKRTANIFLWGLMVCLFCPTGGLIGASVSAASQETLRIVRGEVVASNLKDDPQVIVVRVVMPNKEELIVGATVPPGTDMKRGKRAVTLADIKPGEVVVLGYLKNPDGLVARSIHVQ